MPDHPPIPPNCRYFVRAYDQDWFEVYHESLSGDCTGLCVELSGSPCGSHPNPTKLEPDIRKLIASVARCAWLDEAHRLDQAIADRYEHLSSIWDRGSTRIIDNEIEDMREMQLEADVFGIAWRTWGEAKP